jgi:hypothetical protein
MYIQGTPVEIQAPTHWNLICGSDHPRRLYYRPGVFFRHLHLIALSFPHGSSRRAFQKCYYLNLFTFLKTERSEIA